MTRINAKQPEGDTDYEANLGIQNGRTFDFVGRNLDDTADCMFGFGNDLIWIEVYGYGKHSCKGAQESNDNEVK
jgi:hypothetical protein